MIIAIEATYFFIRHRFHFTKDKYTKIGFIEFEGLKFSVFCVHFLLFIEVATALYIPASVGTLSGVV